MKLRRACKIVVTTETINVIYEMNETTERIECEKKTGEERTD